MICNPGSRNGRCRKLWPYWLERLKSAGIQVEQAFTRHLDEVRTLTATSGDDIDTVIVAGGDGTINRAIDGILQSGRNDLRLGVLYAGTSPDFCRFHGIPTDFETAPETIAAAHTRTVDIARIQYTAGGQTCSGHFGCSSNIGLGPRVARGANRLRPFAGDGIGTAAAAVSAISRMKPIMLNTTIDGEEISFENVCNLSVLLNPYLASGLKLDVPLSPDDGLMTLVFLQNFTRRGLLRHLPRFYSGQIVEHENAFVRTCQELSITVDEGQQEIEFDGDSQGTVPATIEVLPRQLQLICPDKSDAAD